MTYLETMKTNREIMRKAEEIFEDSEDYTDAFNYILEYTEEMTNGQFDDFLLGALSNSDDILRDEFYEWYKENHDHTNTLSQCPKCGTLHLGYSGGEYFGDSSYDFGNLEGKEGFWCVYCAENWQNHHNTIKVVDGDEVSVIWEIDGIFKDMGAWGGMDAAPLDRRLKQAVEQLNPHYHRIDGWRGYDEFDTPQTWVNTRTGWIGSGSSSDFHEIMEDVAKGHYCLPYPVIMVVAQTSNVFAVNVDVYVPEENEDDFEKLFTKQEHIDYDTDETFEAPKDVAEEAKKILPKGGQDVETVGTTETTEKLRIRQKSMDVWKPDNKLEKMARTFTDALKKLSEE